MNINDLTQTNKEILWAQIFNSSTVHTTWFKNKNVAPGRWAAGYPFLYALYRTLDEIHPKHILELGMGQTTKMIGQYVYAFEGVDHTVVEHDEDWIDFFADKCILSERSRVLCLPITKNGKYKTDHNVVEYKGFKQQFQKKKYDLICIDGPYGYMAKEYARIDVLKILPHCLSPSWAIFIDDAERLGEKNTIQEMYAILQSADIKYCKGIYSGSKDTMVIASDDLRWICSM